MEHERVGEVNVHEVVNPFSHLLPAWEALSSEAKKPTMGTSIPTGVNSLDAAGWAAVERETAMFDGARRAASLKLRFIIVG